MNTRIRVAIYAMLALMCLQAYISWHQARTIELQTHVIRSLWRQSLVNH